MAEVNKLHPGQFSYILNKDAGTTGNLECTIYRKTDAGNRQLIHSKRGGQGYPYQGWEAFNTRFNAGFQQLGK